MGEKKDATEKRNKSKETILRINYRIPIIVALVFLAIIPISLLAQDFVFANQIAIYAYYLLVIGIVWQCACYLRERQKVNLQDS